MKITTPVPIIDVKEYGGKQVAIVDGQIVASGATLREVIEKARLSQPSRPLHEIKIFAVPKTLSVIYHVAPISLRHHAQRRRKNRTFSGR